MPTESGPPVERRVVPADCSLLVGIPTDRAAFVERLERPTGYVADMARARGWTPRTGTAAWALYESGVAAPLLEMVDAVRRGGVEVRLDGSLSHLRELAASRPVLTVFAHCEASGDGGTVELFDGTLDVEAVAAALPDVFDGVLELALCESWVLGERAKRVRPRCLVVMQTKKVVPAFRAKFYRQVIRLLSNPGGRRYTETVLELAKESLR